MSVARLKQSISNVKGRRANSLSPSHGRHGALGVEGLLSLSQKKNSACSVTVLYHFNSSATVTRDTPDENMVS